jgi:retron-type reverse transcriptase
MNISSIQNIDDICKGLGLQPQFLFELAKTAPNYYSIFEIRKRNGGTRKITASRDQLKVVQRVMLDGLFSKFSFPSHVHGGVKGRSILTSAKVHVNKEIVLSIDLSNFFGSITFDMLMDVYQQILGYDWEAAELLCRLTTYDDTLPQGAPTSPFLANLAALSLDQKLIELCSASLENGWHFTRYIDDVTISGGAGLVEIIDEIYQVIESFSFEANRRKTKIRRRSSQQNVTGVIVNTKLSPPRKLSRKLRQHIYYCNKYGIDDHSRRLSLKPADFVKKFRGQIAYIRMTRPTFAEDLTYILGHSQMSSDAGPTEGREFEERLVLLSQLVEAGKVATIIYEKTECRIAPSSIGLDEQNLMVLFAFQLEPTQVWRHFFIERITSVVADRKSFNS